MNKTREGWVRKHRPCDWTSPITPVQRSHIAICLLYWVPLRLMIVYASHCGKPSKTALEGRSENKHLVSPRPECHTQSPPWASWYSNEEKEKGSILGFDSLLLFFSDGIIMSFVVDSYGVQWPLQISLSALLHTSVKQCMYLSTNATRSTCPCQFQENIYEKFLCRKCV